MERPPHPQEQAHPHDPAHPPAPDLAGPLLGLARRIEVLERENKRFRRMAVYLTVGVAVLLGDRKSVV